MIYHLIHISKTGGSAIRGALRGRGREFGTSARGHDMTLAEVPAKDKAFFVVRDPVDRFVSGFNSRLRKGQPLRFVEWKAEEAIAFARFGSPRALADALADSDPETRRAAEAAMDSMIHTRRTQASWLGSPEQFETMIDRVAFVGHQPTLTADFEILKARIGLAPDISLPTDARSHRTPDGFDTSLSEAGRTAVTDWYADDYRLYRRCLDLRATLIADTPVA